MYASGIFLVFGLNIEFDLTSSTRCNFYCLFEKYQSLISTSSFFGGLITILLMLPQLFELPNWPVYLLKIDFKKAIQHSQLRSFIYRSNQTA